MMRDLKNLKKYIEDYIVKKLEASPDIKLWEIDRGANKELYLLKTILNAVIAEIKEYGSVVEEATEKSEWEKQQKEITKFWNEYEDDLKAAKRMNQLLGGSFDYMGEKLNIYESALRGAASGEDALFGSERIQEVKRKADALRAVINLTTDLADENEHLHSAWERKMDAEIQAEKQTEKINSLFMQATVLANNYKFSLMGLTNHYFDSAKAAKKFKEILDKLEMLHLRGLLSEDELKRLQELFNIEPEWNLSNTISKMNTELDMAKEKADLLTEAWDANALSVSILEGAINRLLNLDISEVTEEWVNEMENAMKELRATLLAQDIANLIKQSFENLYVGIGEYIGKALAGADEMNSFFDMILSNVGTFLKRFGELLIAYGVAQAAFKKAFLNPVAAIAAGVALVAIGSAIQIHLEKAQDVNTHIEGWGMARGGIVPQGYPNDSYPAMLSSGEKVVPPKSLPNYEKDNVVQLPEGGWVIRGQDLYYVMREMNRKYQGVYR